MRVDVILTSGSRIRPRNSSDVDLHSSCPLPIPPQHSAVQPSRRPVTHPPVPSPLSPPSPSPAPPSVAAELADVQAGDITITQIHSATVTTRRLVADEGHRQLGTESAVVGATYLYQRTRPARIVHRVHWYK